MKKKAILSALFSAFVACFFVACSNDSDALDINAGTRSVTSSSYMTREEVQTRLDEIGEKYGETIILVPETDITKVTEDFFTWVESVYQIDNTTIEDGTTVVDDEQIDEITISKIGTYAAPGENGTYTGTILNHHVFTVRYANGTSASDDVCVAVVWTTSSSKPNKVTASISEETFIQTNSKYTLDDFYYTMPVGPLNNPSFNFSYKITATFANGTSETLNWAGTK
ncbi:MAG: hypothetical protein IJD05_03110 [Bacteroidaceae bacterium]|nr:hypothetical protein [Bacteroidaceae bacterium]